MKSIIHIFHHPHNNEILQSNVLQVKKTVRWIISLCWNGAETRYPRQRANDRYKDNLDGQSTTKTANTANTFAQNWRLFVTAVCRTKLIYITISFSVVWSYMCLILHKMTTLIPSAPLQSHGSTYQFQDCNGYKSQDKKIAMKIEPPRDWKIASVQPNLLQRIPR